MLTVLHILSSLNLGGAERVTVELAQVQRQESLDAQILSLGAEDDFFVDAVNAKNIPLHICGSQNGRIRRYIRLFKLFRKFDVLHIHSRGAFKFLAPIVPLMLRKKIIYTRHGLHPDAGSDVKFLYLILRPFLSYVTFVTQSACDVFVKNHNWDRAKLVVVKNGVSVPEKPVVTTNFPVRFGSVGRMVALKGQPILLDAIKKLELSLKSQDEKKFSLKFFGIGPLEQQLRQQANSLGQGIVEFCGEEPDLEKVYDSIDVLIVASESEGLSMVILEAMARGIPVIATDVGGNSSLVENERTGFLINYADSDQLFESMAKFLDNLLLIEEYGSAAKNAISEKFSLSTTYSEYLNCYTS